MNKNKKIIAILVIILIIIGGYLVYQYKLKDIIADSKDSENYKEIITKDVKLEKDKERFQFDSHLNIDFYGKPVLENSDETLYSYYANIKLDDNTIKNNLFSDSTHYRINSDNMASIFTIYRIKHLYFLISKTGAQIDGHYVVIIDTKGNIIKEFDDVTLNLDIDNECFIIEKLPAVDGVRDPFGTPETSLYIIENNTIKKDF